MGRSVGWFGAALIAAGLACSAQAQTTLPAPAQHHAHKHQGAKPKPEGRPGALQGDASATPSWLTLNNGGQESSGNNYVNSTFDQPSTVQGTMSGYRGRERVMNGYGVPGAPLSQF